MTPALRQKYDISALVLNASAKLDGPILPLDPTVDAIVAWLSHHDRNGDYDGLTLSQLIDLLGWIVGGDA